MALIPFSGNSPIVTVDQILMIKSLAEHDAQWAFVNSGDPGWQGDDNESPDAQFYKTETNFNLDLNNDGRVGAPPNNAPVLIRTIHLPNIGSWTGIYYLGI